MAGRGMGPTAESAASEDGAAAHGAPDGAAEPFRARDGSLGLRAGTAVVLDQYGTVLCATHDAAWLLGRSLGIAEFAQYSAMPKEPRSGTAVFSLASGESGSFRYHARPLDHEGGGTFWLVQLAGSGGPVADEMPAAPARPEDVEARSERRSRLARAAALSIGASLDLKEIAERLADSLVPAFADLITVDVPEVVLNADEPPPQEQAARNLRRIAVATRDGRMPPGFTRPGEPLPDLSGPPRLTPMAGRPVVAMSDMAELRGALRMALSTDAPDDAIARLVPAGAHALLSAPMLGRGRSLGILAAWRLSTPGGFDDDDAELFAQIASRGALALDNARRFAREHRTAVALQRSLLPSGATHTSVLETAGTYVPAEGEAGVGGDWYDVLPLSSLRTAFAVGDVVGHGLGATVAMGRLRTAVQTMADLDPEPGELLAHLNDLMQARWTAGEPADPDIDVDAYGTTVLYAVHDPIRHTCVMASAGHPPPVVLRPGRAPEFAVLAPSPPLGVGALPFEEAEIDVPPGTLLAFYTDGVVARHGADVNDGMDALAAVLDEHRDAPLDAIGPAVLARLEPPHGDDVALLLVRTHPVPRSAVAEWDLPADPSVVARARELTLHQLDAWGLDDLAFTTELVVSELVTNAIRYGGAPIGLRLIRDEVLICEVSDPSNSQPRQRRAQATDEGGRGLFLVAQLTSRWGSRYRRTGKTIWTEQRLDGEPVEFPLGAVDLLGEIPEGAL
ncbi:ATP-binding SpoIIE family protein phosphatase [Uniformispora flossi]|uniref:ATP-binding SpoIIE family protein phosphatase n=1 Tax=Uniformispora flossi TaxID=3390723 RepID=UPI003C2B6A29